MKFSHLIKTAFAGIKTNKTRAVLTMLGIIIGIASVVTMISLGNGAQNLILGQVMTMGSNNIFIRPGAQPKGGSSSMMQSAQQQFEIKTLKVGDATAIAKDPLVEYAAPYIYGTGEIVYENEDKNTMYAGITPDANKINDVRAVLGRDLTADDVDAMARVVVLGYNLKDDLFGMADPIGKSIRINKTDFRVVGVMEEQGSQMFQDYDDYAFVPITSAQKFLLGIDHIQMIIVKMKDGKTVNELESDIRATLRQRHDIYNPEGDVTKDDFKIVSQKEAADILSTVTGALTVFLSSIAAIALVVGGIGIMNIMLVSVTERTAEVGLRKAVGAHNSDILSQFLFEALALTVIGGALGVLLGLLLSYLASVVLTATMGVSWSFSVPLNAILLALGVSSAIGLVFGIYPAKVAADLSPIEALRHE